VKITELCIPGTGRASLQPVLTKRYTKKRYKYLRKESENNQRRQIDQKKGKGLSERQSCGKR